jgi:L-threonylcarbamoyladenylate synthase
MEEVDAIHRGAEIIRNGGVVAFPTETVYGLGADAFNPIAIARVFEIKNRPYFDPLIVHIANLDEMSRLVIDIPHSAEKLIKRFWPGPLTIVLLRKEAVPDIVTAGLPTVAIRMPRHPVALQLIKKADRPIAAPSANPFGYVSPTTAEHVREQLGNRVDLILDGGPCEVGLESTILSFSEEKPRLLRPGGLPIEEIESVIGGVETNPVEEEKPSSPGRLPRHYAPRTPIVIEGWKENLGAYQNKKIGLLAFREMNVSFPYHHVEVLSPKGDLREAAANLFAAIRRLDALNLDGILAEPVPEAGLGRAIMDRLRRASEREKIS